MLQPGNVLAILTEVVVHLEKSTGTNNTWFLLFLTCICTYILLHYKVQVLDTRSLESLNSVRANWWIYVASL